MTVEELQRSVEGLERSVNDLMSTAADHLRNAVIEFDASSVSLSSIEAFRERVLLVADHLAQPLPVPVIPEPAVAHVMVDSLSRRPRLRQVEANRRIKAGPAVSKFVVGAQSDRIYQALHDAGVFKEDPASVRRIVIDLKAGELARFYVDHFLDDSFTEVLLKSGIELTENP